MCTIFFACLTIFLKDRNQSGDKQEKEEKLVAKAKQVYIFLPDVNVLVFLVQREKFTLMCFI